ncbi:MAG: hypothetical protein REI09_14515, partial [Candidatus Dactylopiibacterium sp.]|nr:hypothetical protein [Candidatus Dactylopiibacterium sp.]
MTPRQTSFMAAAAALALAATAFGAYRLGAAGAPHGAPPPRDAPAAAGERRVLDWHDPKVPGQR